MSDSFEERVSDIVFEASKLPLDQREGYLSRACGADRSLRAEVEELLAYCGDEAFLENPIARASSLASTGDHGLQSDTIGRYKILRVLGEGGMGVVYEAEQEEPRRRVALKVLRLPVFTTKRRRRFELEAEALGRLLHPGIAQIYDADTADGGTTGHPYFVMELVRGRPLDEDCTERNLDTRGRLQVFVRICDAVHYAHQKGVIHRDLKPDNILVDRNGQPKVLDFGVARVTDGDFRAATEHTKTGQIIGTLPFMSPEQVAAPNEIDVRSDVYSLGVILYQLLARKLPYDLQGKSITEAARIIQEETPVPLGAVHKDLEGDLSIIVGKSLEKSPSLRYQSAAELSTDVQRFLAHQPILARKPTTWYQIRKFSTRHKALVSSVVCIGLALLIGLIVAHFQRLEAIHHAEHATIMKELYRDLWIAPDPVHGLRPGITALELIELTAPLGLEKLSKFPEEHAEFAQLIARTHFGLGDYKSAVMYAGIAASTWSELRGQDSREYLYAHNLLGRSLHRDGELTQAETILREVLDKRQRLFGENDEETTTTLDDLASVTYSLGKAEEAEKMLRSVVQKRAELLGPTHLLTLDAVNDLAGLLGATHKSEEALELNDWALEEVIAVYGDEHSHALTLRHNRGISLRQADRIEEATETLREVAEVRARVLGPFHPHTLSTRNNLAGCLYELQRYDEAVAIGREVTEAMEERLGEEHPEVLTGWMNLASSLRETGESAEAHELLRRTTPIQERILGPEHVSTIDGKANWVLVLWDVGLRDEALSLARYVWKVRKRDLGSLNRKTLKSLENLSNMLQTLKEDEEAVGLLWEFAEGNRQTFGADHPNTKAAIRARDLAKGRILPRLQKLKEDTEASHGTESPQTIHVLTRIGLVHLSLKETAQALTVLTDTLERALLGEVSDDSLSMIRVHLSEALIGQQQYDEAETHLSESLEFFEEEHGIDADSTQKTIAQFVSLYEAWGNEDEAEFYREQLSAPPEFSEPPIDD